MQLDACGVCGGDDSSCSGCTNPDADNYDPSAIVDDGSCIVTPDCPEDLNNDGLIVADILELLADFGCTSDCDADLNGDGATNVNDILQIWPRSEASVTDSSDEPMRKGRARLALFVSHEGWFVASFGADLARQWRLANGAKGA